MPEAGILSGSDFQRIATPYRLERYVRMIWMEKVENMLHRTGRTQEELALAINVRANRISKWKTTGWPRPHQLLAVARYFGVSLESLVDDTVAEPEAGDRLTKDEQALLYVARAMDGGPKEAVRRLAGCGGAPRTIETDSGNAVIEVTRAPSKTKANRLKKRPKANHSPPRVK